MRMELQRRCWCWDFERRAVCSHYRRTVVEESEPCWWSNFTPRGIDNLCSNSLWMDSFRPFAYSRSNSNKRYCNVSRRHPRTTRVFENAQVHRDASHMTLNSPWILTGTQIFTAPDRIYFSKFLTDNLLRCFLSPR